MRQKNWRKNEILSFNCFVFLTHLLIRRDCALYTQVRAMMVSETQPHTYKHIDWWLIRIMGLWQACAETDWPGVLLSQVLFNFYSVAIHSPLQGTREDRTNEQKNLGPVCVPLCHCLRVTSNKCVSASLWGTTVTFSPSFHHELPYTLQGPYLLCCVWVHKASLNLEYVA